MRNPIAMKSLASACAVAVVFILSLATSAYAQVTRNFTPRFSINAKGNIVFAANANTTCSTSGSNGSSCNDAKAGNGGSRNQNNDFTIIHVDVDSDGSTFNSSRAALNVPSGATVIWAGLYWSAGVSGLTSGAPDHTKRYEVQFKTPALGSYTPITASQQDNDGYSYSGFSEVTALVQAAGNGDYFVGNIQVDTGTSNRFSGWSLVVVYEDLTQPLRNLSVFDGAGQVNSTTNIFTVTPSGFTTPLTGAFDTYIGAIATDGDLDFTGDQFRINGVNASDPLNGSNDFFNSSITNLATAVTTRSPNTSNTLGYDADIVNAPTGSITNGDTSADVTVTTGGESISLHVLTFATDIFEPDVIVTKNFVDLNGGQVEPGDILRYEVEVVNNGVDTATDMVLTDNIPSFTSYVANSLKIITGPNMGTKSDGLGNDQAEFDSGNNRTVFRIGNGADASNGGSLAYLETTSISFEVEVDAGIADGTTIFNQAAVSFRKATLGSFDISTGSNAARATVGVGTDLVLEKADHIVPLTGSINAGETLTYTINVSNDGPEDATDVLVSDPLPVGTTFLSASGSSGWTVSNPGTGNHGTVSFSRPSFTNGSTATFTIQVQIDPNSADNTLLQNTATISSLTPDVNDSNNKDTEETLVRQFANLSVSKTAPASVAVGNNVTFTIELTNSGPATATNVDVTDVLPTGLTYVSSNPSTGTYSSSSHVWTVPSLASSTTATLEIVATVTGFGPYTNTAEVTASDQPDPNSSPNNQAPSEDDQDSATVQGAQADLTLTKTADQSSVLVGQDVIFTILVTNNGPSAATGIEVEDQLPAGLTLQSATPSQGTFSSGTWDVGTIANGDQATLTLVAEVTGAGPYSNIAQVTASDLPDPNSTPGNSDPNENDQSTATVGGLQIDLELEKTVSPATIRAGEQAVYALTIVNNGSAPATGVAITDVLPSGLTLASSSTSHGTYAGSMWTVGNLAISESATLMLTVTATTDGTFVNSAEVTAANESDPDSTPGNNQASEDDQASASFTATPVSDLALTKTVDNATPLIGSNATFTVTVTNNGPSEATNVQVEDKLPMGLSLVSATESQGTYTSGTGLWDVGSLANGASATLTVVAMVTGHGPYTNTAQVSGSDQYDPNSIPGNNDPGENDQDTATVGGTFIDLELKKVASAGAVPVGSNITFTLTVHNNGSANATGVVVEDVLPAGLDFVNASTSDGAFAGSTWTIGNIAIGGVATLALEATVTGVGPYVNTAQVTAANEPDINSTPNNNAPSENDQDTATVSGIQADLALTKTVSPANASMGDVVTYTITVVNNGPTSATGVQISDQLPAGISYNAASASMGAYDGAGTWIVGNLPNGSSASLTVHATVTQTGTLSNVAEVAASDQPDPNSTPGNNDPGENDQDSAPVNVVIQEADLSVTKTVDQPAPTSGDQITFTITATNDGPGDATGVEITDDLPAGLIFVSAAPSQGSFDQGTGLWTVGTITNGQSATLEIVAEVPAGSHVMTNVTEVTASNQTDPDSTPNNDAPNEDDRDTATITTSGSSGGGNAGVESDGNMATKLAQRLFHRRKDAQTKRALRAEPTPVPFTIATTALPQASKSGNATDLARLTPTEGPQQSQPFVTTPLDILLYTNATSVYAVDYFRTDGVRLGALFGTTTPSSALYDHSKLTCDRLGGARIASVKEVRVKERPFILTEHRHLDGTVDYAISFVAFVQGNQYTVDNRFVPDSYTLQANAEEIVNMQVWGVSPTYTITLVEQIIDRMGALGNVSYLNEGAQAPTIPQVYVTGGHYEAGTLTLDVANWGEATSVTIEGTTAATETAAGQMERTPFTYSIDVPASTGVQPWTPIKVAIGSLYDAAFTVSVGDEVLDRAYYADGPWGTAHERNSTLATFETYPFEAGDEATNDYRIERNAYIAGDVQNWVSLFRYLRPGGIPVDLSNYDALEFTAYGAGTAQVYVDKASILDGNQYGSFFRLTSQPQRYRIALDDLRQTSGTSGFTAEDVTALVFYVTGNGRSAEPFFLVLEEVRFTGAASSVANEETTELPASYMLEQNYPNPFNPQTTIAFEVPQASPVRLLIFDMLGREVRTLVDGTLPAGRHEVLFDATNLPSGTYLYRLETPQHAFTKTLTLLK